MLGEWCMKYIIVLIFLDCTDYFRNVVWNFVWNVTKCNYFTRLDNAPRDTLCTQWYGNHDIHIFHPLEVASRYRDPQLQVGKKSRWLV